MDRLEEVDESCIHCVRPTEHCLCDDDEDHPGRALLGVWEMEAAPREPYYEFRIGDRVYLGHHGPDDEPSPDEVGTIVGRSRTSPLYFVLWDEGQTTTSEREANLYHLDPDDEREGDR